MVYKIDKGFISGGITVYHTPLKEGGHLIVITSDSIPAPVVNNLKFPLRGREVDLDGVSSTSITESSFRKADRTLVFIHADEKLSHIAEMQVDVKRVNVYTKDGSENFDRVIAFESKQALRIFTVSDNNKDLVQLVPQVLLTSVSKEEYTAVKSGRFTLLPGGKESAAVESRQAEKQMSGTLAKLKSSVGKNSLMGVGLLALASTAVITSRSTTSPEFVPDDVNADGPSGPTSDAKWKTTQNEQNSLSLGRKIGGVSILD